MKKTLVFAAAISTLALVSCKKDRDCECTSGSTTTTYTIKESKKSAAAALCEGKGYSGIAVDGVDVPEGDDNCTLK